MSDGIVDAQLRRALRARGADALAKVTRLEWDSYIAEADRSWKPIGDLRGLEACVALEHVGLVGNHVSDLAPLAGLQELVEVWLTYNGSSLGLGPLAGKRKLRVLEASSCGVSDVAPLADDVALTMLGLDDNRVSSVEALAGLVALDKLGLRDNQIGDVGPLAGLVALQELRLGGNAPLVDVAPLAGLVKLRELDLHGTGVRDVRPLLALPALTDLRIAGSPAASDAATIEAFRARGVRIDGEGKLGAAATWTVTPLALVAFGRRERG